MLALSILDWWRSFLLVARRWLTKLTVKLLNEPDLVTDSLLRNRRGLLRVRALLVQLAGQAAQFSVAELMLFAVHR